MCSGFEIGTRPWSLRVAYPRDDEELEVHPPRNFIGSLVAVDNQRDLAALRAAFANQAQQHKPDHE